MAFRPKLLALATAFLGLASPVSAAGLSAIDAFSCAGQGTGYSAPGKRKNWVPEYYRGGAASYAAPRDGASTVKLRIIYDMGDRIEIDHCGGTVIDRNWIVTAGHCVAADRSWDRVEVIAGSDNLDGSDAIKRISNNAVCHAGFRYETLENDIALLHVENPLPARVTPTALDFEGQPSLSAGDLGLGHGWPVTGVRAGDRFLNQTYLQVHGVDLRNYITVTNASGPVGGLCRGESGGPILSNGRYGRRLAGILSGIQPGTENHAGEECMLGNYEMYFTPIAAHRRWIDNVKSLCTGNPAACGGSNRAAMSYASVTPQPLQQQYSYQNVPLTQPSYQTVAYSEPAQPTYQTVAYAEPVQPTYQTVAYVEPAKPTYIDVGSAYGYATAVPAPTPVYYQPAAPVYQQPVAPAYIDTGLQYGTMAPIYDNHAYAPAHGGYNVAYAQPTIIYGSAFRRHAR